MSPSSPEPESRRAGSSAPGALHGGAALEPGTLDQVSSLVGAEPRLVAEAWRDAVLDRGYRELVVGKARPRRVQVPLGALDVLQRIVLDRVLSRGPVSAAAHAGVRGRSVIDAARRHLRIARETLRIDIRDAFLSTSFTAVRRALRRRLAHECHDLALTGEETDAATRALAVLLTVSKPRSRGRSLPLGASTSVAVFNLVCQRLDRDIEELIADETTRGDAAFTRYVDDIVLSSRREPVARWLTAVERAVRRAGFRVAKEKTRVLEGFAVEVHGFRRAFHGIEPGASLEARLVTAIAEHRAVLESAESSTDARHASVGALRGLDGFLRQIWESTGARRPESLRFEVPRGSTGGAAADPADLWP